MNEMYFRNSSIQKKMDSNSNLQAIMKATAGLIVFVIFICSLSQADTMKVPWIMSMLFIILLFIFDLYYIKKNKKYEFDIYNLEITELEHKKKVAEITGEILPDVVLEREIKEPTNEISLPILYYAVMLILDIIIKILMIR